MMLLPLLVGGIYREWSAIYFLMMAAVCGILGGCLCKVPSKRKNMYPKDGFVAVALCWICISLLGALPFTLSGEIPSYVDAVFEMVSGFTTTGSSILTNVEGLSHLCFSGAACRTGSAVWAFWFLCLRFCPPWAGRPSICCGRKAPALR